MVFADDPNALTADAVVTMDLAAIQILLRPARAYSPDPLPDWRTRHRGTAGP